MTEVEVKLTYFKPSGKYYSEGSFNISAHLVQQYRYHEIYQMVRNRMRNKTLPGLVGGHSDYTVLVSGEDIVPALLTDGNAPGS